MISLVVISTVISDSLNAVNWVVGSGDPYIARYGVLFNKLPLSAYDDAVNENATALQWFNVIHSARVAEIDGYWSSNIEAKIKQALDNHPMLGNLPEVDGWFQCLNRYLLHAFRYAEKLNYGLDKWKKVDAFNDFKSVYNTANKPILRANPPSSYYIIDYGPRYYDEAGETLDIFMRFYELGVTDAWNYMLAVWDYINVNLWLTNHYKYALNRADWECSIEFFLIALRLKHWYSDVPNWDRCATHIKNGLTIAKFGSPHWSLYSIVHHHPDNPQRRLPETLNAYALLHTFYPLMDGIQKAQFISMLKDSVRGCDGLIDSSGLYDASTKKFRWYSNVAVDDTATTLGCATLLLQGIIPATGHLFVPIFEERYVLTLGLLNKYFRYDAENHKIMIPVRHGVLGFQFGDASPCTALFENDAVYEVEFEDDWNSVKSTHLAYTLDTDLIYATPIIAPPPPPPIVEKACSSFGKAWGFRRWSVPQNLWK